MLGFFVLAGFSSGLLMGASFRLGGDAHPDSLLVQLLASFCAVVGPAGAVTTCRSGVRVLSVLLSAVGFLGVVENVPSGGDWRTGVVIYVASLFVGILSVSAV